MMRDTGIIVRDQNGNTIFSTEEGFIGDSAIMDSQVRVISNSKIIVDVQLMDYPEE